MGYLWMYKFKQFEYNIYVYSGSQNCSYTSIRKASEIWWMVVTLLHSCIERIGQLHSKHNYYIKFKCYRIKSCMLNYNTFDLYSNDARNETPVVEITYIIIIVISRIKPSKIQFMIDKSRQQKSVTWNSKVQRKL